MANVKERRIGEDLKRLDPLEGRAQDLNPANVEELRREIARLPAGDPRRAILVAELQNIGRDAQAVGIADADDFSDLGINRPELNDDFSDLGIKPRAAARPAPAPSPTPEPDRGPALAGPGEFSVTPGGAVTGRTQVPAPRRSMEPEAPPPVSGAVQRLGIETGGAFLGGSAGARVGGPVGMRVGEAAGATLGSLFAETVDPTERPLETAGVTGSVTFLTGTGASLAAGIGRKLAGKPHEAGQALADIMARKGLVPPPGAVLESDFIRNAEAIGSSAFGTSELLKKARTEAADVTADAVRNYVSGFQRYHEASRLAFREVDDALGTSQFVGQGVASAGRPGLWFKGWDRVRDALTDVAEASARLRGTDAALDTHLQKILKWKQDGGPAPLFTFEETQKIYSSLYDKARSVELRAARGEAVDKADHEYVRGLADQVRKAFDEQIDFVVRDRRVPVDTKDKLLLARASWSHWLEGKEIETMVLKATKDAVGEGPITGSRLLGELSKVARREKEVGHQVLSPNTKENVRRYALALSAVEESGKSGAYAFIGRVGQLAGLTGAGFGLTGPGAALFLAPHVLAWTFSNAQASALLLRGLKLEPGTAAAARVGRELVTLWEKEQLIPPQRVEESGPVGAAMREEARRRAVPD